MVSSLRDYYTALISDNNWKDKLLNSKFVECNSDEVYTLLRNYAPKRLFKYLNINNYTLENLSTNNLVFRDYRFYNDPYDSFIGFDIGKTKYKMIALGSEIMLNLEHEDIKTQQYKIANFINNNMVFAYYCCCFSEVNNSILMWSHYANEHKGFCIEYNFQDLLDCYREIYPIVYKIEMNNSNIISFERGVTSDNKIRLFTKYIDWAYEKEWRVVKFKNNESNIWKLFKTPIPVSVYMGCKISDKDREALINLAINKKFNLYQMKMNTKSFKLEAIPIYGLYLRRINEKKDFVSLILQNPMYYSRSKIGLINKNFNIEESKGYLE